MAQPLFLGLSISPTPSLLAWGYVGLSARKWLRGVDLNHRPLGYEPKRSILSPVESIALPRSEPANA